MQGTIEQIRLIHKAFEDEPNHIATYVPNNEQSVDTNLEDLFKRTQNLDESWIKDQSNFSMRPVVDTRSTSCGDIMVVCYPSKNGNGYKEKYFQVVSKGFKQISDGDYGRISQIKGDELVKYFTTINRGGTA
jgi:hypothetical protein